MNIVHDSRKLVVISSEKALKILNKNVETILQNIFDMNYLAGEGIFNLEILFLAVLRQKLLFEESHKLNFSFVNFADNNEKEIKSEKKITTKKGKKS